MYIDARNIEDQTIEGDICIIGAGVAGITIALEWINTPYKVILLEGGGFEYDEKVQELYEGKLTGQHYYPMMSSRLHYFGGTSGHWGGMCSVFDAIDFWKRDWVNMSGWPINIEMLEPYYSRAQPILDLGPNEYHLDYWQKQYGSFIPLPFDKNTIWNKMWQFSTPTRFGTKYKEDIVNSANISLYTYANCVNINSNENVSEITGVKIKNYAGKEHIVKAKYFVLACSAIQNARVLLASNTQAQSGIGNDHDLVGRYFMEHIEIQSGELWLNKSNPLSLYMLNGRRPRAELAICAEKQEELQILNGTVSLMPLEIEKQITPGMVSWDDNDPRKSLQSYNENNSYKKPIFQRIFPSDKYNSFGLYTRVEQSPNPESRVTLNDEKDSLGVSRTTLNWALSLTDKESIRKINRLVGQQVGKSGIGRVKLKSFLLDESDDSMPSYTSGGWHHIGTTRMNNDPKKGVVNSDCKVHGIENLYVAGSSCFATAGAVNPTLTIVAFSLRLSDYLKERMKEEN